MALHDAPSCKRTILFSTMATIKSLDLGPLTKAEKEKRVTLRTVRALSDTDGSHAEWVLEP